MQRVIFLLILIFNILHMTAVIAITKHGIQIANRIKERMPEVEIYVPAKLKNSQSEIIWFTEQVSRTLAEQFKKENALICIFSLGAVIRLIAPILTDKRSDPAILVIDDKAKFVVSALSGHLGGANALARLVASFFPNAQSVITTAADVNETIAVDLVGKEFGWTIENLENVTKVSALMVNEEKIGLYQSTGEKNWWHEPSLPKNVESVHDLAELKSDSFKGALIISDKIVNEPTILSKSVIYRPKSLVIGIGLHWDTRKELIESGIASVMKEEGLSLRCVRNIASINRKADIEGLKEFSNDYCIPIENYDKDMLSDVNVPNPSEIVQRYEGTPSVSESSSILSSKGQLIVPKRKFPPNLTLAVARAVFN